MKFEWFDSQSTGKGRTSDVKGNKCRVSIKSNGNEYGAVTLTLSREFCETVLKAEYVKIAIANNSEIALKKATSDESGRFKVSGSPNSSTVYVKKTIRNDEELKKWENMVGMYLLEQFKSNPNIFIGSEVTFDWL